MKMTRVILAFPFIMTSAACGEQYRHYQYLDGPEPAFVVTDVENYSLEQNRYLNAFAQMAGFFTYDSIEGEGSPIPVGDPLTPDDDARWKEVARAGMNYIDRECARYIDAIFWYDRAATTVSSQINITGAATTGIMGLAGMAAESLAITAIAFGFASESVDNIVNSVLYQLNPSTVRAIVAESQEAYREEFERNTYNSRQGAVAAIRGYLGVCLPPSIETTVNIAVMNANIEGGSLGGDLSKLIDNTAPELNVTAGDRSRPIGQTIISDPVAVVGSIMRTEQVDEADLGVCVQEAQSGVEDPVNTDEFLTQGTGNDVRNSAVAICVINKI